MNNDVHSQRDRKKKWFASAIVDAFGRCAISNVDVFGVQFTTYNNLQDTEANAVLNYYLIISRLAAHFYFVLFVFALCWINSKVLFCISASRTRTCAQRMVFFFNGFTCLFFCFLLIFHILFLFPICIYGLGREKTPSARINHKHDHIEFTMKSQRQRRTMNIILFNGEDAPRK